MYLLVAELLRSLYLIFLPFYFIFQCNRHRYLKIPVFLLNILYLILFHAGAIIAELNFGDAHCVTPVITPFHFLYPRHLLAFLLCNKKCANDENISFADFMLLERYSYRLFPYLFGGFTYLHMMFYMFQLYYVNHVFAVLFNTILGGHACFKKHGMHLQYSGLRPLLTIYRADFVEVHREESCI